MNIGILLALGSAVAYGASDFIGGVGSRRYSSWQVVLVGQAAGAVRDAGGRTAAAGRSGRDWTSCGRSWPASARRPAASSSTAVSPAAEWVWSHRSRRSAPRSCPCWPASPSASVPAGWSGSECSPPCPGSGWSPAVPPAAIPGEHARSDHRRYPRGRGIRRPLHRAGTDLGRRRSAAARRQPADRSDPDDADRCAAQTGVASLARVSSVGELPPACSAPPAPSRSRSPLERPASGSREFSPRCTRR